MQEGAQVGVGALHGEDEGGADEAVLLERLVGITDARGLQAGAACEVAHFGDDRGEAIALSREATVEQLLEPLPVLDHGDPDPLALVEPTVGLGVLVAGAHEPALEIGGTQAGAAAERQGPGRVGHHQRERHPPEPDVPSEQQELAPHGSASGAVRGW
ncbi:MAG TPA: hypothetical protein VLA66_09485 [Thermoanaerobaculia bacterium]|nr:hypothetical protein [Thermoanaerobaculia bacterium]